MQGGNLNFDCLNFKNQAADARLVMWIYSKYPEWDRTSCRLTSVVDRKIMRSWEGNTLLANGNEV